MHVRARARAQVAGGVVSRNVVQCVAVCCSVRVLVAAPRVSLLPFSPGAYNTSVRSVSVRIVYYIISFTESRTVLQCVAAV